VSNEHRTAESSDEAIRSYLKATLEHLLAAGHCAHELVDFSLQRFGMDIIPHLEQLQEDIRERRLEVANLAGSTRTAVFAIQVSPEQWEEMVREAAHLRADMRGFAEGNPEEDWYAAEEEIEALIERQAGLLERAERSNTSIAVTAERELAEIANIVDRWRSARAGSLPPWPAEPVW
jgi:hypothetical protein